MAASSLSKIIKQIRVPVVAKACGRTPRAIYKWIGSCSLPRTDYTGETKYEVEDALNAAGIKCEAK